MADLKKTNEEDLLLSEAELNRLRVKGNAQALHDAALTVKGGLGRRRLPPRLGGVSC